MGILARAKFAWKTVRAFRKGKKMANQMKPIYQSKTTATIAGSTATAGGMAYAIMQGIRGQWPTAVPWGLEGDAVVVALITTVLGPLLSRLVARLRKGNAASSGIAHFSLLYIGATLALAALVVLGGCAHTIQHPDGRVEVYSLDANQVQMLATAAAVYGPHLFESAMTMVDRINELEAQRQAAKDEAARARIEQQRRDIEQGLQALLALAKSAQAVSK